MNEQAISIEEQDDYKTNKTKSFFISSIIYISLLAILYFLKIGYTPIVEEELYGVDLNYGLDQVGSGDLQTLNKANDSKIKEEMAPEKGADKPVEPQPVKSSPPKPTPSEPVKNKVITADEDTKVTAKTADKPAKKPSPVVTPVEAKPVPKSTTPAVTAPPKPAPPARNVETASTMKKNPNGSAGSNGTVGSKAGVGGNNNGDGKPGEVGDKGSPKGTPDGKSLYGTPGKGGGTASGASVSISGWKNKGPLNIPKDNSSETGKIRFKVVIDDFGDVQRIDVIESSLSPSVTNYYKNQITQKLKSNLIPEGTPPPRSTGTITINITRGA